jgi:hypothetical protein
LEKTTAARNLVRIADVLFGKQDANLVSRPFDKAKAFVKSQLAQLGHATISASRSQSQTSA